MKYEIDTIPVWDAVKEAHNNLVCPLCLLEKKVTFSALRYYLSDAVMVPEIRVQMNEKGFSRDHWRLLLQDGRRLPLALAAETRWKTFLSHLQQPLRHVSNAAEKLINKKGVGALFTPKDEIQKAVEKLEQTLSAQQSTCLIQEKINETMGRYLFTLVQLPFKDSEFKEKLDGITLCPYHLVQAARMALDTLDTSKAANLIIQLLTSSQKGWRQAQEDIFEFTQRFDPKSGGDFSGLKDAPEKVIAFLAGWIKIRDRNEEKHR